MGEEKRRVSGRKIVLREVFAGFRSEAGKELTDTRASATCGCPEQPLLSPSPSALTPGHGGAGGSWESTAETHIEVSQTLQSPGRRPQQHHRQEKQNALPGPVLFLQPYSPEQAGAKPRRCILGKDLRGHPPWLGMGSTTVGCSRGPTHVATAQQSLRAARRAPVPGVQGGDSLHHCHWKSSAKPWPQEIPTSRNKSLFHLIGCSFPMV